MPQSLVWATDLDVLPLNRMIERHHDHLSVLSPSNPTHYWGNLLLFDDPPVAGDSPRWEQLFENEIDESAAGHRTFAWDTRDGSLGAAREEFLTRGYELAETVGLVGTPDRVRPHPRANRKVSVVALDPSEGTDLDLWEQVLAATSRIANEKVLRGAAAEHLRIVIRRSAPLDGARITRSMRRGRGG